MKKKDFSHKKLNLGRLIAFIIALIVIGTVIYKLTSKSEAAWYNNVWGYRIKLTVDHTKVGADQTDFPVYLDLSLLPKTFFNHINADGGDIRVTKGDGLTELPREVVYIDKTSFKGELHFKYSGILSSTVDTNVYIYYGNASASDYAVTATYGRNNVWDSNYIGVWHLSEKSGNHSNSTGISGLDSDSVTVSQQGAEIGQVNRADYFNGSTDYFRIPLNSNLLPSSDITVESWVKLGTLASVKGAPENILSKLTSANDSYNLFVSNSDNKPRFTWQNNLGTSYFSRYDTALTAGTWNYLVGVHDSTTLRFYYNGSATGTVNGSPTGTIYNTSPSPMRIGSAYQQFYLDGSTDEVRISSSARSATWISTQYNNQKNVSTFFKFQGNEEKTRVPILYYAFNEGYGTTTADTASGNYPGTFSGSPGPTWQTEDLCISGKCLLFNGSTANVTVANTVYNLQTVSFWVKPATNSQSLVDFDGGTHYISASSGTITATGFSGTVLYYVNGLPTTTPTLTANVWQHISITTSTPFDATSLTIGKHSTSYLNGFLDDFKIYDYVRSAADDKSDYIIGAGGKGSAANLSAVNPDIIGPISNGLMGYWKMDESTANSCAGGVNDSCDSSGNGLDAAWAGGATNTSGKFGNGVVFSANGDYDSSPENSLIEPINDLTISLWANLNTLSTQQFLVAKDGSGGGGYYIQVDASNTLQFGWRNSGGTLYTVNYGNITAGQLGAWLHVVAVKSNNVMYIYLNGNKGANSTVTTGTMKTTTDPLYFGSANATTGSLINGRLDEVRIYNRALTPSEVSQLYNWAPGPVGWWKMDEGTGTKAYDSSAHNNDGTLGTSGQPSDLPSWQPGKFGSALSFNGGANANNYVSIGASASINNLSQMTFDAWIYPRTLGENNYGRIFQKDDGTTLNGRGFEVSPGNELYYWHGWSGSAGQSAVWTTPTNSITLKQWNHVVISYDDTSSSNNPIIYINGVNQTLTVGTAPSGSSGSDASGTLYLGNRNNGGTYDRTFDGYIDDARIYNYIRSPSQVTEDMNVGHPLSGSPVGSSLVYWKFDEGHDTITYNTGNGGSSLNGSITGGTWTNAGKLNQALTFTAGTSVTTTITDPGYNNTVSIWVYPTTSAASKTIVTAAKLTTDSSSRPNYGSCVGTALSLSTWTHIVAVSNGSGSCTIYQNGIQTATGTTGVTFGTSINVGASSFTGNIDEFKFFNSPLTADQVTTLYNLSSSLSMGTISTDSSGNAINSFQRSFCPPGNTEGNCGSGDPSPVGYWKFDDNTGALVNDSSGNGNTGTWSGSGISHWAQGKYGGAGNFNGTNDIVTMAQATPYAYTTNYTVEAWVKSPTLTALGVTDIVCRNSYFGLQTSIDAGGGFRLVDTFGHYAGTTVGFSNNTWHHVVAEQTGSTVATIVIYVDGVKQATTTSGTWGPGSGNGALVINKSSGCVNAAFPGQIDDVRIYPYIRTQAQVAWDYNRGAPLGWWKMDECSGTVLHDSMGNIANGTISIGGTGGYSSTGTCNDGVGTDSWNAGTTGKINSALALDGSDDYATVPDNDKLSFGNSTNDFPFSISLWVYDSGVNTYNEILSKINSFGGTKDEYELYIDSSSHLTMALYDNSTGGYIKKIWNTANFPTGSWQYVTFTYDGSATTGGMKLYLNGNEVDNTSASSSYVAMENTAATLNFGAWINGSNTGSNVMGGILDDIRIYNYALTPQQINTAMNDGAVHFGP